MLGLVVRGGVLVDVEVLGLAEVCYALVLEGGGLVVGECEVGRGVGPGGGGGIRACWGLALLWLLLLLLGWRLAEGVG